MTGATLCSGIGAPEVAMPEVDWQWCAEIEPFPSEVLATHRPGVPNLGDITAPDFIEHALAYGPLDILVAGTPCQAFSVAGQRRSLEDERGNLTLRFVEIVHAINPRIVEWENVPGVLSTEDNAFGCFLAGLVGAATALVPPIRHHRWRREPGGADWFSWPDAGMVAGPERVAAWRILDAQYFRLAQRRRRVFVVSGRTGERPHPGAILFEPESLRRNTPPSREARQDITGTISARTKGGGGLVTDFDLAGGVVAHSLNAKGGSGRIDAESETFVTCPLTGNPYGDNEARESLLVAHSLRGDGFDASEDGTGRGTPLVAGQWGVRRLMPIEAERLQGFPDNYTLVPHRGKPAADGPRYKSLGNSMAVSVLRWIIGRIEKVSNETNR